MNETREALLYTQWIQPSWAPPSWVFGPVWGVLYAIIAVSFGYVFYKTWQGELSWVVASPFALNLILNASFTWVQFGLQSFIGSAVVILLIWATIVWAMWAVWPHYQWVAYAQVPYLLWVSFATVLQLTITWLNL